MKGWDPAAFDKAIKAAGWRFEELSEALIEAGWDSGVWSCRRWAWSGSPGPKPRVQSVAIAELLGCRYQDLVKR